VTVRVVNVGVDVGVDVLDVFYCHCRWPILSV